MERETLKEQNERLAKELKEARAQIQQLQQEVAKANEEIILVLGISGLSISLL